MEQDYFYFESFSQTSCNVCHKVYNNAAIPEFCTDCNAYFPTGKSQSKKPKKSKSGSQAYLLSESVASVRVHPKGHSTRTFVSIGNENKVKVCLICSIV